MTLCILRKKNNIIVLHWSHFWFDLWICLLTFQTHHPWHSLKIKDTGECVEQQKKHIGLGYILPCFLYPHSFLPLQRPPLIGSIQFTVLYIAIAQRDSIWDLISTMAATGSALWQVLPAASKGNKTKGWGTNKGSGVSSPGGHGPPEGRPCPGLMHLSPARSAWHWGWGHRNGFNSFQQQK